ncbi:MAG: PD40 domain-containing protein, partial [Firmicutes bacterium]|nr:PD40 domain-containing protein [Bacillota bacterium]
RVLFARQGTQPDGPHKGERGVSFRLAAPEEGEAREVAWLPVPRGMVRQLQFLPDKESVFVHVTGALWRVDIPEGRRTLLRGNLPSYDGLFYPRLSPDGNWYVYGLLEPDKSGIYVLATADGGERALAPNGRTWNFHPQFSPDGGHLAYYAAPLKAGRSGRDACDYDIVPEEDGPAPVAAVVEIATPEGQKVATLTVPGMKITGLRWSADGRYLAFAAGKIREEAGETGGTRGMDVMEWHSLWVSDLRGGLKKVADLEPTAGYVNVLSVGGDGTRVYYVTSNRDTRTLWLGREGSPPVEVLSASTAAGGSATDVVPVYGEDLLVSWRGPAGDEIFRLRGTQAVPVTADGGAKAVLGMAQNRLVYLRHDRSDVRDRLVILALE